MSISFEANTESRRTQGERPEARKVAVFPAWPYTNGPRHLGHGASLLPADIMARYYRATGADVLMVSGTDEFGTPNVIAAAQSGKPVEDYVLEMNRRIVEDFIKAEMSFDWFTRTTTPEHREVAQYLFEKLAKNGYLQRGTMLGSFDSITGESLPDRYVEGKCPFCGADSRGDQCESCSELLDPIDLEGPVSTITKNSVNFQETEHWFLMLDKIAPILHAWVSNHENLRPNAKKSSIKQIEDLHPRAITRDMEWGVPIPADYVLNQDKKVLYVWFEALTGYLSASIEWAKSTGDPDRWKDWWLNPDAEHIYAMGKDNVPFHTILWPAILLGASEHDAIKFHLPDRVASTEYLTHGDKKKFSSRRGDAPNLSDLIEVVGVDPTRYYLINNGPETHDKEFSIGELITVNNEELLSKWGNLVRRIVQLAVQNFDGVVPEVALDRLPPQHGDMVQKIQKTYKEVGILLESLRLSAATRRVMELCTDTNRFINQFEPWNTVKTDRTSAAHTVYTSLVSIDNISRLFMPFIPSSSRDVHACLGYGDGITGIIQEHLAPGGDTVITGDYAEICNTWDFTQIPPGQPLTVGEPLFKKLKTTEVVEALGNIAH